jgi:hypothetical protein
MHHAGRHRIYDPVQSPNAVFMRSFWFARAKGSRHNDDFGELGIPNPLKIAVNRLLLNIDSPGTSIAPWRGVDVLENEHTSSGSHVIHSPFLKE